MLVTYAPLVNVFGRAALVEHGIEWSFLARSHRDALLLALCQRKPNVLLGESSFLRVALGPGDGARAAGRPCRKALCLITAGTPLDLELLPVAEKLGYAVHDLYGCQEFGWLTLDGVPLRDDISLIASPIGDDFREVAVGGLPMGDSFPYSEQGHICNPAGPVLTYKRRRTHPEYEVIVKATTRGSADLIDRTARTILRIKGRIVKVSKDLRLNADGKRTASGAEFHPRRRQFRSQRRRGDPRRAPPPPCSTVWWKPNSAFQSNAKTDPTWIKRR